MHEDSPEDVVHDVFTEALWPGHPLGRPILGTKDRIRAATSALGARLLPAPLRAGEPGRGGGRQRRPRRPRDDAARAHGHRGDRSAARASGVEPPIPRRGRPRPSGASLVRRRKTEQAHIVMGTNGLPRDRPGPFRPPRREHRARRRDVVAAVPGDPREAGPGVHGVQLPRAVHGSRAVRRLRRAPRRRAPIRSSG